MQVGFFFLSELNQYSVRVLTIIIVFIIFSSLIIAGAWSFSVSELAAPGVEVGRLTATDPDLGENAQLEFTVLDTEESEIFNITGKEQEAIIVLNKVSDETHKATSIHTNKMSTKNVHNSRGYKDTECAYFKMLT